MLKLRYRSFKLANQYPTTVGIGNSRGGGGGVVGGPKAWEIPEGMGGKWLNYFVDGELHFGGTETHGMKIELPIFARE